MKNKWNSLRYLGYDAQILATCRPSIDEDNLNIVRRVGCLLLGLLAVLLVFYLQFDNNPTRNFICLGAGLALCITMIFCNRLLRRPALRTPERVDFLIDVFSGICFLVGIYLGTFAASNDLAVTSVWMFFFVILIFNRFPLHNLVLLLVVGLIFTICSYITKDIDTFRYDALHGFISIVSSLYMAWLKSQMKVENTLALTRLESANLEILETVEVQQREALQLRHRVNRDELTGLYKRHAFETAVHNCLQKNPHSTHALICTDVDNFKAVNDSFGHPFGDRVLKDITDAIKNSLPECSVAGRFGGDEFLIFIQNVRSSDLLSAQLTTLLANCRHTYQVNEKGQSVSLSAGVALYPGDARSYTDLFERADKALYHAKREGKGRFSFYTDKR